MVAASAAGQAAPQAEQDQAAEKAALHLRLGEALRELDRDEEAIDEFRRALEFDPEEFLAHARLGSLLASTGDLEAARGHLERAIELEPRGSAAHLALAEVLRRQERWTEAKARYETVIELDPKDENAYIGRADASVGAGSFAQARDQLEAALVSFPASRGLRFGLTWILAASPDEGLRDGARALSLARELFAERRSVAAAELMAAAHGQLGECEQALELQRFVVQQALEFGQPSSAMERLVRAVGWYGSPSCRVPGGRPAGERPAWPRVPLD